MFLLQQGKEGETILQKMARPVLPDPWCQEAVNNFNQQAASQGNQIVRKLCAGKFKNTGVTWLTNPT